MSHEDKTLLYEGDSWTKALLVSVLRQKVSVRLSYPLYLNEESVCVCLYLTVSGCVGTAGFPQAAEVNPFWTSLVCTSAAPEALGGQTKRRDPQTRHRGRRRDRPVKAAVCLT